MKPNSNPKNRVRQTNSKRVQRSSFHAAAYQVLEDRRLLAANIFYEASTGTVTVISDAAGDRVDVTQVDTEITVAVTGGTTQAFGSGSVSLIRFFGNGGDDHFYNDTSIASHFVGHAGDDFFSGGSSGDTAYGGDGADTLLGGDGNDHLVGDDGDDLIDGGLGNDTLHGGNHHDTIMGGDGDDYLAGEFGNDTLDGGDGVDYLLGSNGNDDLTAGAGDDFAYGQGDDDVVRGNEGNDRVRGNNGNDILWGGLGNDFIMADSGDDYAYGEAGNDRVFAFEGTDFLDGGDGDDEVIGEQGTNTLMGGDGQDLIIGGTGVDYIFGEAGDDLIYGREGNDELDGGTGADRLLGGDGDDALYGSELSSADELVGGAGNDWHIRQANDVVEDYEAGDAVLDFIDGSSNWTDAELVVLKDSFRQLYSATGNTFLLRETLNDDPLKFIKYDDLGGSAGINFLRTRTSWYFENGQPVYTYTYEREIRIVDWDETDDFYNDQFVDVIIHEIAHNWDSELELSSVSPSLANYWTDFEALSGWTSTDPNDSTNFSLSHDGQWWYSNDAQFAESYGRTNPNEDLATIFEYYFHSGPGAGASNLDLKVQLIDDVFTELSTL